MTVGINKDKEIPEKCLAALILTLFNFVFSASVMVNQNVCGIGFKIPHIVDK